MDYRLDETCFYFEEVIAHLSLFICSIKYKDSASEAKVAFLKNVENNLKRTISLCRSHCPFFLTSWKLLPLFSVLS